MTQIGFYFDMNKCSGCHACQIACKDRNDLAVGMLFRNVRSFEAGTYPDAHIFHYAQTCNHCTAPACVANCPTGAMQKTEDGAVLHDDAACIGCGTCVESCPYGVPAIDADAGIARKCDSCKALRDAGKNPVCVDACTMRCLDFGDIEELRAKYGNDLTSDQVFLPASDETTPSVLIKRRESVDGKEATEIIL